MIKSMLSCCEKCEKRFEECHCWKCPDWVEWFTRTWEEIQKLVKEDNHERS